MPYKFLVEKIDLVTGTLMEDELTPAEKQNEKDIAKMQRKYLIKDVLEFEIEEQRYLSILSKLENTPVNELEDVSVTKERNKLYETISKEYREAKSLMGKGVTKSDRIKYCKIYFLGNMGQADKNHMNEGTNLKGRYTIIPSPYTGIGVLEAEKYLIKNNWKLDLAFDEIKHDRGIGGKYQFLSINFMDFFSLFDEKKRKNMNSIIIVISILIFVLLIYITLINHQFLAELIKPKY